MSWHHLSLDSYKFNCSFMHISLYYLAIYFIDWTLSFLSFVFVNRRNVWWIWDFSIVTSRKTAGFSMYSEGKTCTDPTKALKQRQRCMSLFHANGLKDGNAVVQRLASLAQIPRGPGPFLRLQVLPGPAGVFVGSSHSLKTCTGGLGRFVTPSWPIGVNVNGYLSLYVGPLMSRGLIRGIPHLSQEDIDALEIQGHKNDLHVPPPNSNDETFSWSLHKMNNSKYHPDL